MTSGRDYAGVPVYIVHVSTRSAAAAIARARQNGQSAWGETCPQYLLLDEDHVRTEDFNGAKFVCCPPLRTKQDQEYLWDCLSEGKLQTVGTDHCAFNFEGQKDLGKTLSGNPFRHAGGPTCASPFYTPMA